MKNPNVRCVVCRLSKVVEAADFVHVRLGLDEPPDAVHVQEHARILGVD